MENNKTKSSRRGMTLLGAIVLLLAALFCFKTTITSSATSLDDKTAFVGAVETTLEPEQLGLVPDLPSWAVDEMSHGDDESEQI